MSHQHYQNPGNYYNQTGVYPNNYANQTPYQSYQNSPLAQNQLRSWFDYQNPSYIKGAVVGAAVALLLSNPTIKKSVVKGVVGIWENLQGGVEELKEQIRDVQAEKGTENDV